MTPSDIFLQQSLAKQGFATLPIFDGAALPYHQKPFPYFTVRP